MKRIIICSQKNKIELTANNICNLTYPLTIFLPSWSNFFHIEDTKEIHSDRNTVWKWSCWNIHLKINNPFKENTATPDFWMTSVGIGARYYSTQTSDACVIHVEIIKPLTSDGNANGVEFRITTKHSF
ncbi:hypothetical protein Q4493_02850 [Colwellia sp. 1_MG-2023]|uniref:hypothetical protein n=1 Tax=Colwellia sp. 1_MG-2023 TaxID=3062649 RepID=UPI0026E1AC4C|nr:hypothetical protein [Colwellia sp. 1_MG-2023]MDO6444706.1 hypothetical protein [Colwellia sp. 1_MG-2023]